MAEVLGYSRAGRSGFLADIVLSLQRYRRPVLAATLLGGLFGAAVMSLQAYVGYGAGVSGGEPARFMFSQKWNAMHAVIGLAGGAALGAGVGVVAALVAGLTGRERAARAAVVGVGLAGGAGLGVLLGWTVAVDRGIIVSAGTTGAVARDHAAYVAEYEPGPEMRFSVTGQQVQMHASVTRRPQPLVPVAAGFAGAVIGALAGRGLLRSRNGPETAVSPSGPQS